MLSCMHTLSGRAFIEYLLALCLVLLASGCASRTPLQIDAASFRAGNVDPIYVMPVIDARSDKEVPFAQKDEAYIRDLVKTELESMGYVVKLADQWEHPPHTSNLRLPDLSMKELSDLIPPGGNTCFVVTLNALEDQNVVLAAKFSATTSLALLSRSQNDVIWKDVETGVHGGSGVITAALSELDERKGAYDAAIRAALLSFPRR